MARTPKPAPAKESEAPKGRPIPTTPRELRKYLDRASIGDGERALIGCALMLNERLQEIENVGHKLLDVVLKQQAAMPIASELSPIASAFIGELLVAAKAAAKDGGS